MSEIEKELSLCLHNYGKCRFVLWACLCAAVCSRPLLLLFVLVQLIMLSVVCNVGYVCVIWTLHACIHSPLKCLHAAILFLNVHISTCVGIPGPRSYTVCFGTTQLQLHIFLW